MIYYITKANYDTNTLLNEVEVYKDDNKTLGECIYLTRNQVIRKINAGDTFYTITRNYSGYINNTWAVIAKVNSLNDGIIGALRTDNQNIFGDDLGYLPLLLPRRKTFISYYHNDDNEYKKLFEFYFGDLIINKSVRDGDINKGNSDEYIKYLIQNGYLDDASVIVVLISKKTKCRMHIDWEISGALNFKVGNNHAGLIGLHLPTHIEFGIQKFIPNLQPARLADNAISKYGKIYDWTDDRVIMQRLIEEAYYGRDSRIALCDNSRLQMSYDTCK